MTADRQLPEPYSLVISEEPITTLRTLGDVQLWLDTETQAHEELQRLLQPAPYVHSLLQDPRRHLNEIRQAVAQARVEEIDGQELESRCSQLVTRLNQFAKMGGAISFSSPAGQELKQLAEREPHAAAIRYARRRGAQLPGNELLPHLLDLIQGGAREILDGFDYRQATATQKSQLTQLRKKWNDRYLELEEQFERDNTRLARRLRALRWLGHRATRTYERHLSEHDERMAAMETAFSTDMKLGASELMWEDRWRVHYSAANRWFTAFLGALLATIVGIGGGLIAYVGYLRGEGTDSGPPAPFELPPETLVFIGAAAFLAFWLLRTLGNEYRRHRALADDAAERHTMVKTFKALEYEEKASEEERALILQALFRPFGRAPEETMPNPLWQAIIERMQRS